jgi:hypothetical protein
MTSVLPESGNNLSKEEMVEEVNKNINKGKLLFCYTH